jgi:hypothetical protein
MLAFTTAPSRNGAHPFDIVWAGTGMMLGLKSPDDAQAVAPQLVSTKPQDQSHVVPSEYGYGAQSPLIEAISSWNDLTLGYGLKIQEDAQTVKDRRYRYGLRFDGSIAGLWLKGPEITTFTPATTDATNGVKRGFELNGVLYFLVGRYVLQRVDDTSFTVALDLGVGKSATDVAVFYSNNAGAGSAAFAYIALGDSDAVWRGGPTFAVQNVAVSGTPTGGTFRLAYNGIWTAPLAYNATASQVQTALQALTGLSAVSVAVVAGVGTVNQTYAVTFNGVASPATLTVQDLTSGGSHAVAVSTATAYAAVAWTQRTMQQSVVIGGTPGGGTYTLTYGNQTTAALAFNANAAAVQAALRLLTGLGSVVVTTTGDSPNYSHLIDFTGVADQTTVLTATSSLTGGAPTITIATTQNVLKARAWCVTGRDFWRAHSTNLLAKVDVDADPFQEADWTAPNAYVVGDKQASITRLAVTVNGTLIVFKQDGPWTLDASGQDYELVPHLHSLADTAGGEPLGYFMNDIYVTYQNSCYRLGADLQLAEIGPERLTGNDSPVKGRMTAYAGHGSFCMYGGVYNQDTGDSYMVKFGAWTNRNTRYGEYGQRAVPESARMDVWHGSISQAFTGKQITLLVRSTIGAASAHQRLYVGFSDGSFAWFTLPCSPNPAACSAYRFTTVDADVYLPLWNAGYSADQKALRAVTVESLNLSSTNSVTVQYKADPSSSGTYTSLSAFSQYPRQRNEFATGAAATLLDVHVVLTSSASTSCPQVTGVALHHQVRTPLFQIYTMLVLAEDGLLRRDGSPMRYGAYQVRSVLQAAAGAAGSQTVTLPDGTIKYLAVIGYEETMAWDHRTQRWRAAIKIDASEVTTGNIYGTYSRLEVATYAGLEALGAYSALEAA